MTARPVRVIAIACGFRKVFDWAAETTLPFCRIALTVPAVGSLT